MQVSAISPWMVTFQTQLAYWTAVYELASDPATAAQAPYSLAYATQMVQSYSNYIANFDQLVGSLAYTSTGDVRVMVDSDNVVSYSLDLQAPERLAGSTLQVTTSLISVNDYGVHTTPTSYTQLYDAGETVIQQTEEVILSADGTGTSYTFQYDPSAYILFAEGPNGPTTDVFEPARSNLFQLVVTVTDPLTGSSQSTTYDRYYYFYRCPYGIIYDKATGQAIANATVTVHNVDGSVVALDKSANPNVTNPQTTDATGRYNCKLAIGKKYYMTVTAPGYAPYTSGLFSERWTIVREDVAMLPVGIGQDAPPPATSGSLPALGSERMTMPTSVRPPLAPEPVRLP